MGWEKIGSIQKSTIAENTIIHRNNKEMIRDLGDWGIERFMAGKEVLLDSRVLGKNRSAMRPEL